MSEDPKLIGKIDIGEATEYGMMIFTDEDNNLVATQGVKGEDADVVLFVAAALLQLDYNLGPMIVNGIRDAIKKTSLKFEEYRGVEPSNGSVS